MAFEEAHQKNKLERIEIGVCALELAVIAAVAYVMVACISHVVETSYLLNNPNFIP